MWLTKLTFGTTEMGSVLVKKVHTIMVIALFWLKGAFKHTECVFSAELTTVSTDLGLNLRNMFSKVCEPLVRLQSG